MEGGVKKTISGAAFYISVQLQVDKYAEVLAINLYYEQLKNKSFI